MNAVTFSETAMVGAIFGVLIYVVMVLQTGGLL